ncbi:MAG: glycosyltransferase family 4 protein [bacterium]
MKPRILILTDYYYPHWTGISKSIKYLTQALKTSFDFTILTIRYKKKLKSKEIIDSIPVIRTDYLFSISRAKYSLSTIFKFISIIRMFDIVFINSPYTNILPITIIAKIFRKKLIIFHQGDLILSKGYLNKIIEILFNISTFISLFLANKVSTYTLDYAKNSRLLKFFLYKFQSLLVPMPFKKIEKTNKRKSNNIILGFAGRFVEEKGFDILFEAIPNIIKVNPNTLFIFAGEIGLDYENFFKKNIDTYNKNKKYIQLVGLLNEKKIKKFYKSLDFIIVPSRSDCFNLVQTEALLSNTPAISANIPGLRYLINKSNFGITFKKNSSEDLAKKVNYVIKNRHIIEKNYHQVLSILEYKKIKNKAINFFLS